ncbi:MAG: hypothetical protein Q8O67_18685 [Deltaproteobacteria bacterium]|nr:hypothetical protein [Deltaproteobacteria bacterium]
MSFRVVVFTFGLACAARADEPPAVDVDAAPPRTFVSLRGGFGNVPVDAVGARLQVCGEVAPLAFFSIESCGTGAGFLFEPAPEIAHLRAKLRLTSWNTSAGWLEPQLALGFAELQVGDDAAGFDFTGTGPTGVETAGPEAGLSLRWVTALGGGLELLGDAALSLAYFAHAPALTTSMSEWQPSATLSLGIGW